MSRAMKIPDAVKLAKLEARIAVLTSAIHSRLSEREDLVAERAALLGDEIVYSTGRELADAVIAKLQLEHLEIDTAVFCLKRPRDETAFWTNLTTITQLVDVIHTAAERAGT